MTATDISMQKANNAPIKGAYETKKIPITDPNNNPPATLRIAAPGAESAVDTT